jgi:hypothetical protein
VDWDLEFGISNPRELHRYVMLNPFGFAPHSLRLGTSQAKLREASRFWNWRVLLACNEILRRFAPQNDINWESLILVVSKPLTL